MGDGPPPVSGPQAEPAPSAGAASAEPPDLGVEEMKEIVSSLRLRDSDETVFGNACKSLSTALLRSDGESPHKANQAAAVEAGVLEALVAGLARRGASTTLRVVGMLVIYQVCRGSELNSARALQAGALSPVLKALRFGAEFADAEHADRLSGLACDILRACTSGGVLEAVRTVTAAGAVEALVALVKAETPGTPPTMRVFCTLFNLIEVDPDAAVRAINEGAVEAVAEGLRRCPEEVEAAIAINQLYWHAAVLCALLSHKESIGEAGSRLTRCGVVRALLPAAQRHVSSRRTFVPVVTVLATIAHALPDDERPDVLLLLGAMLREHALDATFACAACKAINVLLGKISQPDAKVRCAQSSAGGAAVQPLIMALLAHAGQYPDLTLQGCNALAQLCHAAPHVAGVAAMRCNARSVVALVPRELPGLEGFGADLEEALRTAEEAHDAQPRCEPGEGEGECARCAEQRLTGALCGAAGCFARKRPCGVKALLRCRACRVAAYCGDEHQRAAWAGHKQACRALAEQRQRAGKS